MNADQKTDVYWIRFGGLLDCIRTRAHGAALLIYDNIATSEEASMVDMGGPENAYETFTNIPGNSKENLLKDQFYNVGTP